MTITPDPPPQGAHPWGDAATPYEELGGEAVVRKLVDRFYDRIRDDSPSLRAMHPADDSNSRRNLFEYFSRFFIHFLNRHDIAGMVRQRDHAFHCR